MSGSGGADLIHNVACCNGSSAIGTCSVTLTRALSTVTVSNNNSVITVGPVCDGQATDTLIPGTKASPITSVNESPCVTTGTKACGSCELSGADEEIDKHKRSIQSVGFQPEREPAIGVPEQIDLTCGEGLPSVFWEVEQEVQVLDVQGWLKSFWEEVLDPAPWTISFIRDGYKLPLCSLPPRYRRPNQQSALDHSSFVSQALKELEWNRYIKKVLEPPYICSPLSVASNSKGKLRLVMNLRYLNQFLWVDKFKYEDLCTAILMLEREDYLFSLDLKSGYHHVDVFELHRQFLGFQWEALGMPQFYISGWPQHAMLSQRYFNPWLNTGVSKGCGYSCT